jgi:hypothetical protein
MVQCPRRRKQWRLQNFSQIWWSNMIARIHRRKLPKIGYDLLYWVWTDRDLVYTHSGNSMWNVTILYIVHCKRQAPPLVWEGGPYQQTRNRLTVMKSGRKPQMGALFQGRLIVGRNMTLTLLLDGGGGVECLQRNPASRRKRRKRKSRIWDNKIWSRVPRDSDPRMTALARARRNYKPQTRPFVRESAPHQQTTNCLRVIQIWSLAPNGFFIKRQTGRLTVGRNTYKTQTQDYD